MFRQKIQAHVDHELDQQQPNWNHHDVELEKVVIELEADRNLRRYLEQNAVNIKLIPKRRRINLDLQPFSLKLFRIQSTFQLNFLELSKNSCCKSSKCLTS